MIASRSRVVAPARTERNHWPSDWLSRRAARRAVHGSVSDTVREMRSNCQRTRPRSSRPPSDSRGMVPRVRAHRAAPPDQVGAVVVGGDGRDAEISGQLQHRVLRRADERAAHIHRDAGYPAGVRASADPVAALQYQHIVAESGQLAGGGQSGETGPHHDDVGGPSRIRHALQSTPSTLRSVSPVKVFTALYGLDRRR